MDLCHLFMFGTRGDVEVLGELGFVENFRRKHPGQGTSNACFCFDNAYLEILFVDDEAALARLTRTGLPERSNWRFSKASPLESRSAPAANCRFQHGIIARPICPKEWSSPSMRSRATLTRPSSSNLQAANDPIDGRQALREGARVTWDIWRSNRSPSSSPSLLVRRYGGSNSRAWWCSTLDRTSTEWLSQSRVAMALRCSWHCPASSSLSAASQVA
jgi:hypothetical protein